MTVNLIPPGSIDTPMLRGAVVDADAHGSGLPIKLAAAAAFLASEEASYMTRRRSA
jgi:2-hydroxycyclohexanecarboxyl-CoA dehydrogenase